MMIIIIIKTYSLINFCLSREFFDISPDFPLVQLMTRNKKDENARSVYFVSKQIRDLVMFNGDRIKVK